MPLFLTAGAAGLLTVVLWPGVRAQPSTIIDFLANQGWVHCLSVPSPIEGGDGNREVVAVFRRD